MLIEFQHLFLVHVTFFGVRRGAGKGIFDFRHANINNSKHEVIQNNV
jgi:hypothetical protein